MVNLIKEACRQYIHSQQLANVVIGQVEGVSPYRIRLSQKLLLDENDLVFTETALGKITDERLEDIAHDHGSASFDAKTLHSHSMGEGVTSEETIETSHSHDSITLALKHLHRTKLLEVGDRVVLIKEAGGQRYFVIDRVGDLNDTNNGQ